MKQESGSDGQAGFALDEEAKAQKLERLRQRLQAATPATQKPVRRYEWDVRRTVMAVFLVLVFGLAIVAGSGVFK
ncbi:hypothetical protein GCM10027046_28060 [Uliginosibacterium flavum]